MSNHTPGHKPKVMDPLTVELERFESWVRSHFVMHHEWLKPGQGKWRYAKNETLFMWDAWKARAELTPNVGANPAAEGRPARSA